MPRLANLAALLAAIAPTLTTAALSDSQWTETVGPQELGSTTIDGTMVYSMNHCSIVHSTQCYTSLSTGGLAPTSTSTGSVPSYSSSASESPVPSYGQSVTSSDASVPVPTPSGTENQPASTTNSAPGGEESTTASSTTEEGATSTSKVPDVPTGAAAMSASAVLGNVLVAALAAIAV